MTQEEKQLLLKDLCARLPYAVKIIDEPAHCLGELFLISTTDMVEYETETDSGMQTIYNIRPYLRPMSSMTEEEKADYHFYCETVWDSAEESYYHYDTFTSIDWLNAHHFDYRGLIEKGLALEAPKDMYKTD